ncbi:hypothetical protein CC80DRAFT_157079 [Byssothecium circinans]|uniref:Uncharacterized protein n=1 Tax=Byssothecium circinans TaxID=147558 RepID=A0A6A5UAP2_9PLEO|nr:hypothetical protein CC80DRAFT_157079 [Byssothecium circinans]
MRWLGLPTPSFLSLLFPLRDPSSLPFGTALWISIFIYLDIYNRISRQHLSARLSFPRLPSFWGRSWGFPGVSLRRFAFPTVLNTRGHGTFSSGATLLDFLDEKNSILMRILFYSHFLANEKGDGRKGERRGS